MVSQALVQAKTNYGLAKAASALGATCGWWRASNPLARADFMGQIIVLLDTAPDMQMRAPQTRTKPENWYGAFDTTNICIGDYIVDETEGTFFVGALDKFRVARLVSCNHTVSLYRPQNPVPGDGFYGGDRVRDELLLSTEVPASIIQGTKGEVGETKLPGDTRLPWFSVLLPAGFVQIRTGDILVDEQPIPARYTVSSIELTSMGWRLSAALATP
jgi:hypothetical protein